MRGAVEGSDLWTRFLETRAELYRTGETGCLLATLGLQNGNVLGSSMYVMGLGDATRLYKGGLDGGFILQTATLWSFTSV